MSEKDLGSKLINSIYKYISEKQDELPIYHGNDVSEFLPAGAEDIVSAPKKIGINYKELNKLVYRLFNNNKTSVSEMAFLLEGELVGEYFKAPYTKNYRHVSYSISKTIVALGFGIAVSKGFISVDTKLISIFPEHTRVFMKQNTKNITFKHLLTMKAGVTFDEMSSYFSFDWRKDFISSEVKFKPGEEFYYNSLNSYMLVAAICKVTGLSFMDFMEEHLFNPMGITDITWDKCPMGIERGGWGMKLSLQDMLKFGQLILDEGKWQGKQLVDRKWIKELTTCHVELKDRKIIYGYGYSIWLLRDGAFLMNGLFGQNVYINPNKSLVIATMSSGEELFPDGDIVDSICKFAGRDDNFCYKAGGYRFGFQFRNRLNEVFDKGRKKVYLKDVLGLYLDNKYIFTEYASGVLPLLTQIVYSNYSSGIESLTVELKNDDLVLKLKDTGEDIVLSVGFSYKEPYRYQTINVKGKDFPVAVGGKLVYDEDGTPLLKVEVIYLEEASDRVFKIFFQKEGIRLKSYETPRVKDFITKFAKDDYVWRGRRFKNYIPPDYLDFKMNKILQPDVIGYIDE